MAAIGGKRGNILSHNDLADLNKSLAAIQTQNKPKISDDYTNGDAASSSTTTTYDLTESSISNYVSSVNHSSMRNSYNKINGVSNNDEAEDPVETITFNPLDTRNSSVGDPNSTWREFNEGTERKTLSVDLDFRQSPVSSIRSGQRSPIRNITPRNRTSSTIKTTVLPAITKVQRFPPIGPTGIVLARRGFLVLLADVSSLCWALSISFKLISDFVFNLRIVDIIL